MELQVKVLHSKLNDKKQNVLKVSKVKVLFWQQNGLN